MVSIDDELFLFFLPLALVGIAAGIFVVRNWDSTLTWERFRASTLLWTLLAAVIAAGFVNLSDSFLVAGLVLGISAVLALRIAWDRDANPRQRTLWILLVFLPLSGWILYLQRFPLRSKPTDVLPR